MAKITIAQAKEILERNATEAMQETIKSTAAAMIKHTPVRSGNAIGNWNTSVGSPDTSVVKSTDVTGAKSIRQLNSVANGAVPGQNVFVVNNVDYIGILERGARNRRAAGMRALARAEFKTRGDIAAAKVRNS